MESCYYSLNELKYPFASLETSLKHLGTSKRKICTPYSFKRSGQPAVLKMMENLFHQSEVLSCIYSIPVSNTGHHILHKKTSFIDTASGYPLAKEVCAAALPTDALNNCFAPACI